MAGTGEDLETMAETAGALRDVFDDLETRAQRFGAALTGALAGAVRDGRGLDTVLRQVGLRLSDIALSAALKPVENLAGQAISSLISGLAGATAFSKGGVPGRVSAFADGGVVSAPTLFPMAGGLGLMGEAGSEAILPLSRGPDGRLGVASSGQAPVQVVFNVTATDAASFAKSEGQIAAMLARTVRRGGRGLQERF